MPATIKVAPPPPPPLLVSHDLIGQFFGGMVWYGIEVSDWGVGSKKKSMSDNPVQQGEI